MYLIKHESDLFFLISLDVFADYTRSAAGAAGGSAAPAAGTGNVGAWGGWFPPPIPLQLPLREFTLLIKIRIKYLYSLVIQNETS